MVKALTAVAIAVASAFSYSSPTLAQDSDLSGSTDVQDVIEQNGRSVQAKLTYRF